jgi:hypothetical protein
MNAKTLAELALKIWGITLLVSAVAALPAALLMAAADPGSDAQATWFRVTQQASLLNVVIQGLVGTAVLVWADRITALIESDTKELRVDTNTSDLQVLGFALVGTVVLVGGLQNVAGVGHVLLSRPAFDDTDTWAYLWPRQNEAMVKAVVQVGAGAYLTFGSKSIIRGWSRLRSQSPNDANDSETGAG